MDEKKAWIDPATLTDHSLIKMTSKYVGIVRERDRLKEAMELLQLFLKVAKWGGYEQTSMNNFINVNI